MGLIPGYFPEAEASEGIGDIGFGEDKKVGHAAGTPPLHQPGHYGPGKAVLLPSGVDGHHLDHVPAKTARSDEPAALILEEDGDIGAPFESQPEPFEKTFQQFFFFLGGSFNDPYRNIEQYRSPPKARKPRASVSVFTEFPFENLAYAGPRHFVYELHDPRYLVMGHVLPGEGYDIPGGNLRFARRSDIGFHYLTADWVFHAYDGAFPDARHLLENALYLRRVDVETAHDDDIGHPVQDGQVPLLIYSDHIPRVEPASLDLLPGQLRRVEITLKTEGPSPRAYLPPRGGVALPRCP